MALQSAARTVFRGTRFTADADIKPMDAHMPWLHIISPCPAVCPASVPGHPPVGVTWGTRQYKSNQEQYIYSQHKPWRGRFTCAAV